MNSTLRKDADAIIASSLNAVLPDKAVRRALKVFAPKGGRVLLVAAGKAAWQMAHAAVEALGRVDDGVVVTKYEHVKGEILGVNCYEAGHPVPDENSFAATEKALELVQGLTGLEKVGKGTVKFLGQDITNATIRERSKHGMSHIPEDRHKHGLVLDYTLEQNLVLQRYWQPQFERAGFIKSGEVRRYAQKLIEQYDVRSGQGPVTIVRSMSGGNQQKAIIAREIDKDPELLVAVQPTRGLDVGAIEYIHKQLVAQRDKGKAVLLVSLELDEVMDVSDRILVMYEGEIVGELDPKKVTVEELGLYMAGAKRDKVAKEA